VGSVGQPTELRIRWRKVLIKIHEQASGPLVIAHIVSTGWEPGWYLFVLATPETRLPERERSSKDYRTSVWKRMLEGEQLSGPWPRMSEAKSDGAWRVVQANGRWGS
jgi:hypothetical protein